LIKLASALAGTGDVDRAERMALYLGEPGQRAQTLADISVTLAPSAPLARRRPTAGGWKPCLLVLATLDPAVLTSIADECALLMAAKRAAS